MKDLTKDENWTPEMIYVHRTRLVLGVILGFILGIVTRGLF